MKRNKELARKMRSGKSPYAKYGKKPVRYSAELRAWEGQFIRIEEERAERESERRAFNRKRAKLASANRRY